MFSLADSRAVITGANRGFGAHIAKVFVQSGAHVSLCARNKKLLEETSETLSHCRQTDEQIIHSRALDVTSEKDLELYFSEVERVLGGLDILVNCAGVCGPVGGIDELDWEAWKKAIDIDLYGTVYPCRLAVQRMKTRKYGKIINISGGGATNPLPHLSAYAAAKAAVVRFTETLAQETADWNIDVNAVAPGVLATGLVDEFLQAGVERLGEGYLQKVETQREDPAPALEKAAQLCAYLASSRSDGISGKLIAAPWDPWDHLEDFKEELMTSDIYALRRIIPEDRGGAWA